MSHDALALNVIFTFLAQREIFKNGLLVVTGLATLLVLGQLPVLAIKMADSNPSNGTMLISISARKQHGFSGAEEVGQAGQLEAEDWRHKSAKRVFAQLLTAQVGSSPLK